MDTQRKQQIQELIREMRKEIDALMLEVVDVPGMQYEWNGLHAVSLSLRGTEIALNEGAGSYSDEKFAKAKRTLPASTNWATPSEE